MDLTLRACSVDLARGLVVRPDGTHSRLTGREQALLRYLLDRPSTPIERDALLTAVWNSSAHTVTRACDSTISRLRAKIELDPSTPDHLITVHGVGYRFEPGGTAQVVAAPIEPVRVLQLGATQVDLGRMRVVDPEGRVSALTDLELRLIERLARTSAAVHRDDLAGSLGLRHRAAARLSGLVHRVRAKIEPDPAHPRFLLRTATGYRLEVRPLEPLVTAAPPSATLVGRDRELAQSIAAVGAPGVTLVVGPGGVGKTALARKVSEHARALWVSVGGVSGLDGVLRALDHALGLAAADGVDPARTGAALARLGSPVVVLDEVEGLGPAVSDLVAQLRAGAPGSAFVLTSRDRSRADHVIELGPLSSEAAVELFFARAARHGVRDDGSTRPVVTRWVERLDRLPLAIELSAGRLGVVSVEDQAHQSLLALLSDPTGIGRHASIDDLLVGSWNALGPELRDTLLRLACFRRFTLDDAARVVPDALARVQALRDRSWIAPIERAGTHLVLGLFEVARAFVDARGDDGSADGPRWLAHVEALAALGAPEHLDHLADTLEPRPLAELLRLVPELSRAAGVAVRLGAWRPAARCAEAAAFALHREGRFLEAVTEADAVRRALPPGPSLDGARLDQVVAAAHRSRRLLPLAQERAAAALAGARACDAPTLEARAGCLLASLTRDPACADAARQAAVRGGHPFFAAWAEYMGASARRLDPRPTLERALEVAAHTGQAASADKVLYALGMHAIDRGWFHLAAGRFDLASRQMAGRTPLLWLRTAVMAFYCRSALGIDDIEEQAAPLLGALGRADLPSLERWIHLGRAIAWSNAGHPERARAVCAAALTDPRYEGEGADSECYTVLVATAVQAEVELGHPERALAVASLGSGAPWIETWRALAEGMLGQSAIGHARLTEVEARLEGAIPDQFVAKVVRARLFTLDGDADRAAALRAEAQRFAVEHGLLAVLGYRRLLAA